MKYIYGPVNSRRLGLSLGITLTPHKICDFDCVYCQLGKTKEITIERKEYVKIEEVLSELTSWFQNNPREAEKLQYITISGSGEPSLNIKMGELISRIKKITSIPVCVITNSSMLNSASVREELREASLILPSLDAATPEVFQAIDRPHQEIKIESIIEGLINLRKEFKGKIWLEVMLVKGLNDDRRHIEKLKEAIEKINPDRIQLNSPVRTSAEENILPLGMKKLEKIKETLGDKCEKI
jgi:wyosine [tRNA(Phe)-imidazoG37] synthetase (radical SAM superfamily)